MKRIILFVLSLCLLLSGCSILSGNDGSEGTDSSERTLDTQGDAYKALHCDAQDFSVLYGRNYTAFSNEDGATIFIGDENELNRVEISVLHNGDTAGFDVTEYFLYHAETMKDEDGTVYTLSEDMTQSSFVNGVMYGAVYSFTTADGTAYRYEMLVDTGTQLVRYSCYFCGEESDEPIMAMTDAIKSYQPSADYYESHPLVITGDQSPTESDSATPPVSDPHKLGNYTVTDYTPLQLRTAHYDGGFFSLNLPAGWVIETTGEYTGFGFHAYDPNIPERQIFLYCKMEPFLKSAEAQQKYQETANLVGANDSYGYQMSADAPILLSPTTDYFFLLFNSYNSYINKYGVNHELPVMSDINILEKYANNTPTATNTLDNSIVRASFYSQNKVECQGLMAAQVTDKISITNVYPGIDMGIYTVYNCNGVIAPAGEFDELREQLLLCLASFNFTEEYVRKAQQNAAEETSAILAMSRQMQAAYDSYNSAWSARQTSYDIISQKNSDATLGYDRLYDPDTGEIYRAELGFFDSYDTNRDEYSNPNLQIIDGSNESYYLNGIDYYITD